jgi:hypothetical protein
VLPPELLAVILIRVLGMMVEGVPLITPTEGVNAVQCCLSGINVVPVLCDAMRGIHPSQKR